MDRDPLFIMNGMPSEGSIEIIMGLKFSGKSST